MNKSIKLAVAAAFAAVLPGLAAHGAGDEPKFEFASSGYYLPLAQARLPFESCGITNIAVTLYKAYDNNVELFGLDSLNGYNSYKYIHEIATHKIELAPPFDTNKTGMIELDALGIGKLEPGGYLLRVETGVMKETWWGGKEEIVAKNMFFLSDLGVAAAEGVGDEHVVAVAVNSLRDGSPVAGASVTAVTRANQIAGQGVTDKAGYLRLPVAYDFRGDKLERLIVKKDDDKTVLDMDYSNRDMPSMTTGGDFTRARVYMFAARDIVRPGETFEVQALMRNSLKSGYKPLAKAPVDFELYDEKGNVVAVQRLATDESGFAAVKWNIPSNAATGTWRVDAKAGGDRLDGYSFRVAAYQPDRVKVSIDEVKPYVGGGEAAVIGWSAKYYFGPDATIGTWKADIMFDNAANPAHWKGWTCDIQDDRSHAWMPLSYKGDLSEDCRALDFPGLWAADVKGSSPISVLVDLRVTPEGERTISAHRWFTVFPRKTYVGVREAKGFAAKKAFEFSLLPALEGQYEDAGAAGKKFRVSLKRYEWRHHYVRSGSRLCSKWREDEFDHPELDRTIEVLPGENPAGWRGCVAWNSATLEPGKWKMTVFDGDDVVSGITFWHDKGETGEKMVSAAALDFECDKPAYLPGETVKLSFKSPFKGLAYVCAGWKGLEASFAMNAVRGQNEFSLKIPEDVKTAEYLATVTLVTEGEPKMRRMSGAIKIAVDTECAKLDVAVETAKVAMPAIPSLVKVAVKDSAGNAVKNARVQVMATDEGVLALTAFDTPDPYNGIFRLKPGMPFEVYDLYSSIYPDLKIMPNGEFGGGALAKMSARQRDDGTLKERKTATFTLAVVQTDAEGKASVLLPAAEFTGLLRVMAVAWTADAAGSGEDGLVVREKASARISAPRFAAPGDEFEITAVAFNNDLPESDWEFTLVWPGSQRTFSGHLAKGGATNLCQRVKLPSSFTGDWKVEGVLKIGQVVSRDSMAVAVRQIKPAETEVSYLIDTGHGFHMPPIENDWIDGEETFEDFDTPAATLKGALDWLEDYPYGCLEQTCAKAFPFLAADDLKALGLIDEAARTNAILRIEGAYGDIQAMARNNGAFGMWPWSTETSCEGSLFAWHFIAEGVAAGYLEKNICIPANPSFLKRTARNAFLDTPNQAAYACYILAVMGDDAFLVPARNLLADEKTADGVKFLAAAALVRGGYKSEGGKVLRDVLAKRFWNKDAVFPGCEFESRASIIGKTLFIAARAGVDAESLSPMMAELNRMIRRDASAWGTTYNNAWAAAGLAAAGARLKAESSAGGKLRRVTRIGVKKNPSPPRGAIVVSRRITDAKGREKMTFEKGELAIVTIEFKCGRPVENAVVSALVPGGFEIEDSALKTRSFNYGVEEKTDGYTTPDGKSDIRDDRWLWFGSFYDRYDKSMFRLTFKVRAVTRGVFAVPSVAIEDMYNPDMAGDAPAAGVVVIE